MPALLSLADRPRIEACLAPLRQQLGRAALSEFSFANLWCFAQVHQHQALAGAWPCIAGISYDGVPQLLPLFDLGRAPEQALRERLQGHACYGPIAEGTAQQMATRGWQVHSCRDDADYLYPADHFRHYRGRLLRKKHNQMRQLLDDGRPEALSLGPAELPEALALLDHWCAAKGHDGDRLPCTLALTQPLGLHATLYRRAGQVLGLLLVEHYSAEVAVVRFAKALETVVGVHAYMFHQHCLAHPTLRWLNFEQDLGRPNFRQTKRSYAPTAMLEKYRLTPPR